MRGSGAVRFFLPFGAICLVLCGCAEASEPPVPEVLIRDSLGVMIVEHHVANWSDRCPVDTQNALRIGVSGDSDSPDEHVLFRVMGSRILSDGRIAVINQGTSEVRWFDANGEFLRRAGRRGSGPGEFQWARRISVLPGDTVWVGDHPPFRFHLFGPDGNWVRTHRLSGDYVGAPERVVVLDNGRVVVGSRPPGFLPGEFRPVPLHLVLYRPDGELRDTLGVFDYGRYGRVEGDRWGRILLSPHFEPFPHFSGAGNRLVVGHAATTEFRILAGEDSLSTIGIVRWAGADRRVEPRHVTAERARIHARREANPVSEAGADDALNAAVSPERPVADSFPAFIGFGVGTDDRIWMREYPREPDHLHQKWVGFNPSGTFACRMTLSPLTEEIYEIGEDYVLGLERDELGVERVVRLPLGPPSPASARGSR